MIDHVLGRPSVTFRKYQVFGVLLFWSAYLFKGNNHGPPGVRRISSFLSRKLTAWQSLIITLLWLYVARNFGKVVGLECPEPLANLYTRSFFRATWITTALDAGFWSAMHIRSKRLRDAVSIICSFYYLVCAEQADEKVRKVKSVITLDHLRVSWNKVTTPYLQFFNSITRPRLMRYPPRALRIPRPASSSYSKPVNAWLYYDGPLSSLKKQTRVVLHIPGGGFVAMSPRTHDDALFAWAAKTELPILSLDYQKAPEHPYPYALNECYDVYHLLIASCGRCIGLSGEFLPQIVVAGDSAGGNLAASVVLMILQSGSTNTRRWLGEQNLPTPAGLVLIYPALDMNIGNWMTDEQMSLIRDRRMRATNQRVLRHKSNDFQRLTPGTPVPSDGEDDDDDNAFANVIVDKSGRENSVSFKSADQLKTRLATPSLVSYVSDRILNPEMMRAMIILYIGPHNRPDFSTEFLLSPVLAPESLLAQFPKTYFMTGERDPLVDDTVIMAGRIRQAKAAMWRERREMGLLSRRERQHGFQEREHVEVKLIEGISHGFIQFANVFPEAWRYIFRLGRWFEEAFALSEALEVLRRQDGLRQQPQLEANGEDHAHVHHADGQHERNHRRTHTGTSSIDDEPLEMTSFRLTRMSSSGGSGRASQQVDGVAGGAKKGAGSNGKPKELRLDTAPSSSGRPHGWSTEASSPEEKFARDHPLSKRRTRDGDKSVSAVSLPSVGDDLLARRMKGLTGGLATIDREREEDSVEQG